MEDMENCPHRNSPLQGAPYTCNTHRRLYYNYALNSNLILVGTKLVSSGTQTLTKESQEKRVR